MKGWRYLIELREVAGILSNLRLLEGEFDLPIQFFLTRKRTNDVKTLIKEHSGFRVQQLPVIHQSRRENSQDYTDPTKDFKRKFVLLEELDGDNVPAQRFGYFSEDVRLALTHGSHH